MSKKILFGITLALLLVGILAIHTQQVKATYVTYDVIYIRADGSIEPSDAPITTSDYITYTLTDDVITYAFTFYDDFSVGGIVVERNNIIFDGQNHALQGIKAMGNIGILVSGKSNVTIKNVNVKEFYYGIYFKDSLNSSITGNNITNNGEGILLHDSFNNTISENNITNNTSDGIFLDSSSNSTINENNITNNKGNGIYLSDSSHNSIIGNNVTNNTSYCVIIMPISSNNIIHHNNFTNNNVNQTMQGKKQAYDDGGQNFWDNGTYGNYWSDYTGWDGVWILGFITGKDGIGEQPYTLEPVSRSNKDRYPLATRDPPSDIVQIAAIIAVIVLVGAVFIIRRKRKKA